MKKVLFYLTILFVLIGFCGCAQKQPDVDISSFSGRIAELNKSSALIEVFDGENILKSADLILIDISKLEKIDAKQGDTVKITYTGEVMESYPARVTAISWSLIDGNTVE